MSRAVHNPVQLDDDQIRSRFVVRGFELDDLLSHLREADPPRHALVIGQRGMGKSLLLRRLAIAVADDPDLAARWLPVLMPEELYEVTSAADLWLAALDELAMLTQEPALVEQRQALLAERDPVRLEAIALQRLLTAARDTGHKLLLLAENLDMVFSEQVDEAEQWSLRQTLQTENDLLLIGTAVTSFAGIEESGEPFYAFFRRIDLDPLADDDVRTLWQDVTGVELSGDRIVPIRILTGGNPRLVTVLGQFSHRADLRGLRQDLELLIDEYTPYFKANIETLPPVERKVFVALADIWAPATAAEVAVHSRMSSSKVSALLGRLIQRGAVRAVEQERGRQRYEVTERLYNLYHLLRRPDGVGRVRALVDILTHLYEPIVLERDVLPSIVQPPPGAPPPSWVDTSIASALGRHVDRAGVWADMAPDALAQRIPVLEALHAQQVADLGENDPETLHTLYQVAVAVGRTGDPRHASALLRDVVARQRTACPVDDPDVFASRSALSHFTSTVADPAWGRNLYLTLVEQDVLLFGPDHPVVLFGRGEIAYYTGEGGDAATALSLYRDLIDDATRILGADHATTLAARHQLAYYTGQLGDSATATEMFGAVVADWTRHVGATDFRTIGSRRMHAHYVAQTEGAAAAVALFDSVVADAESALGRVHPETLGSRVDRAEWLAVSGDATTAAAICADVAADSAGALGRDHPETLRARFLAARYAAAAGAFADAATELRALVPETVRVFGREDERTVLAAIYLAISVARTGDQRAALDVFDRWLPSAGAILGEDDATLLSAWQHYEAAMRVTHDPVEALAAFDDLTRRRSDSHGADDPVTLRFRHAAASAAAMVGREVAAAAAFAEVAAARARVHGPDHILTLMSRASYAHFAARTGDLETAVATVGDTIERAASFTESHPELVELLRTIGSLIAVQDMASRGEQLPKELREILASNLVPPTM